MQHWKEGGHDKLCKAIKKAGGAEVYNANKKYTEVVAVAAEKCAEDTKGQTCYICTQALHWKTKEGLVRGCACRGTAGFAHVSCLAEQAKILVAEVEANNLEMQPKWERWGKCSLCEQEYHGVVACALGWACWKTYVGRPETDWPRLGATSVLGAALHGAKHHEEALSVQEAELAMKRRLGAPEEVIFVVQGNLAITYDAIGRHKNAMRMLRDVYSGRLKLLGEDHPKTIGSANNYALSLVRLQRFGEAKALLRKTMPVARRVLVESDRLVLGMRQNFAIALYKDAGATLDDIREAVTSLEEIEQTARRVLGGGHPTTEGMGRSLQEARAKLRARDGGVSAIREAVEAMSA